MTPQVRQWIYTTAAIASALIPLLVAYEVIETSTAGAWTNLIGVLGALGSGGAATAAIVTSRQRKDGTLDFTGSPAEQAVAAIQATVDQAGNAAESLAAVRAAVNTALGVDLPVAPRHRAPSVSPVDPNTFQPPVHGPGVVR